jgi:phosphate acetyltransferase
MITPMDIIKSIRTEASKHYKTIVLPESGDDRTLLAASFLSNHKICKLILLGMESKIKNRFSHLGMTYPNGIEVINPDNSELLDTFAQNFYERRKAKGISRKNADEIVKQELYFAASLVSTGHANGCVAGAINTTGDVLKAAFQVIGMKKNSNVVSSVFLMSFPDGRVFTYGDCAVVPYPNAMQLASIAIDSAFTHYQLTGTEPRVALLSFSSKGSAQHERVQLVVDANEMVKSQQPDLKIDGELQFDAALIEEIGIQKAPGSMVAGIANVFVFPNLDAGNIAYKITERLAGATATGPIIQGLNAPMNDLSRGCSWEDIVNTAAVSVLQSV